MTSEQAFNDHNLLFGMLALQLDFVTQKQLIEAMQAWIIDKKKPLGRVFVEKKYLTTEREQMLSTLVKEHLRHHGEDPQRSLASLKPPVSLCDQLQSLGDPRVSQMLSHSIQPDDGDEAWFTLPHVAKPVETRRFQTLRPLAEGGLGIVSVANDTELAREVALKEIKPRFADHVNSRSRFLQEAEITGRLEHPCIVPVYGLGTYPDGRPYYAMRMIKGQSLHDAIADLHSISDSASDSGRRTIALRELLQRFIDVCNALEYAHSRGIVHRDIKPANIMLGKYRETLVVDWGLAKAIGQKTETIVDDETVIVPEVGGDSVPTRMGEVVGTIAFMSPEQAAGKQNELGPPSDIYSLGATLYNILTGTVAQKDADMGTLLRNIQTGKFLRPRLIKKTIPRALEAICLMAMAQDPKERYQSAAALASDIEHYLADEPVVAYSESILFRTRRWLRKHPRTVGSLAAAVAAGIVFLVAIWLVTNAAKEKLAETNAQLEIQRNEATEARDKSEQAKKNAEFVTSVMLKSFQSPDPELDGKKATVFDAMDRYAVREALHWPGDPSTGAEINRAIGKTFEGLGLYIEAVPLFEKASELFAVAYGADHESSVRANGELGIMYVKSGMPEKAVPLLQENYERIRAERGDVDVDTIWLMSSLGGALQEAGEHEQALELLKRAVELTRNELGPNNEGSLAALNNLSEHYHDHGPLSEALRIREEVVEKVTSSLGPDHPQTLLSRINLAASYVANGQLAEAIPLAVETVDLSLRKLGNDHPETMAAMDLLQSIQLQTGDAASAETTIRTWMSLLEKNQQEAELVHARIALVESLLDQQKTNEAVTELKQILPALNMMDRLAPDRLRATSLMGQVLLERKNYAAAEKQLIPAYQGLQQELSDLPPTRRWYALRAARRVVELYQSWKKQEKQSEWQAQVGRLEYEINQLRQGKSPAKSDSPTAAAAATTQQ